MPGFCEEGVMIDWQSNYKSMNYYRLLDALEKLRENKLQKQFTQKETFILNEIRIKKMRDGTP